MGKGDKSPREIGDPLERYVCATFPGARKTKNSGAVFKEGDVHSEDFLIECKTKTTTEGISITGAEVHKALQQAVKRNRKPFFVMENALGRRWACLSYEHMLQLLRELQGYRDTNQID